MSPVPGLLALIAEMEQVYAGHAPAYRAAAIAESTRLRAWSLGIQGRQEVSMKDVDILDERLVYLVSVFSGKWLQVQCDDSADAIFAKGMNIIAIVRLHALREKFCAVCAPLGETERRASAIDTLLARMQQIEVDLETKSNGVLDYPGLKALNYATSDELTHLHTDLGYSAKRLVGVREVAAPFRTLHAELHKIHEQLALDGGDI